MKLFKIWQEVNNDYDTYDSAIVCAENEEDAKRIHPSDFYVWENDKCYFEYGDGTKKEETSSCWCGLKNVKVEYIGEAKEGLKQGIILASFNAG